jgi:molecular chaperone GrpE
MSEKKEKNLEEELEKIKNELKKCKEEKEKYLAGWQRSRADFLNYIKEEQNRLKEFLEYANEPLILKILPILDSFDRAENSIPQDLTDNQIVRGFLQIKNQLKEILEKEGLEEIACQTGEKFDPNTQEVVGGVESKEYPEESIVEIVQKGYKFKGKVIRPVQVKISKSS